MELFEKRRRELRELLTKNGFYPEVFSPRVPLIISYPDGSTEYLPDDVPSISEQFEEFLASTRNKLT